MKGWSKASFAFKVTVPLNLLTMVVCIYMYINTVPDFIYEEVHSTATYISANSLPPYQQNESPMPSDSQSPSEEFEEDDDDSNREMLIINSFNRTIEMGKIISAYGYYPKVLLDISIPPPRA